MADPDLLEIFSNLVGERQAVSTTVSQGTAGPSSSETHKWKRLALVHRVRYFRRVADAPRKWRRTLAAHLERSPASLHRA